MEETGKHIVTLWQQGKYQLLSIIKYDCEHTAMAIVLFMINCQ